MKESNYTDKENMTDENVIDYKAVARDIKLNGRAHKSRINAYISNRNYEFINELMSKGELISMRLSKGAILDLALTNLFMSLDCGESLETIAINHLERGE